MRDLWDSGAGRAAAAPAARGGVARPRRPRGAALLVVMVAVALVTAVAVELAYQARVSLQIAGNARDELKAQALARGSVALGRLVLHFQAKLDETAGKTQALVGTLTPAAQAAAPPIPRPQLWKLVPVDSLLVANLFGGGATTERPPAGAAAADRPAGQAGRPLAGEGGAPGAAPGGPDGHFQAVIEDEDRKVNVQFDETEKWSSARLAAFLALVGDRRWDFLFDREDAAGQRTTRTDLAVHLRDWEDPDQVQSVVTGLPNKPFEDGFGDENFVYDRAADRYKAKNARFDSLDELFMVTGVSDAFMAAFGDRLTVYVGRNVGTNVNASDPDELLRNAQIMADPPLQPILSDPTFAERLQKAVRELNMGGFVALSPFQFAQLLETMGLSVDAACAQPVDRDKKCGFTDRSQVFTVRGVATVGNVEKAVEAVVTFESTQARNDTSQLGRLLHWREE